MDNDNETERASIEQVQSVYRILLLVPEDMLQQALDEFLRIIPLADDQVANILS